MPISVENHFHYKKTLWQIVHRDTENVGNFVYNGTLLLEFDRFHKRFEDFQEECDCTKYFLSHLILEQWMIAD